jgi:hypothetical protein
MQQVQMSFDVPSLDGGKWRDWLEIQAKGKIGVAMILKVFSSAEIVEFNTEKTITRPGDSRAISEC